MLQRGSQHPSPMGLRQATKGKGGGPRGDSAPAAPRAPQAGGVVPDTYRSMDLQGRWPCVGLPQGTPAKMAVPPPTLTPSSSEGTPSQHSPSWQQRCSALATRHTCSCHLRPAHGTQGPAAVLTGNTPRLVLEKVCQWQRKVSPSLGSSASDHSCHAMEWQCQGLCSCHFSKKLCCK